MTIALYDALSETAKAEVLAMIEGLYHAQECAVCVASLRSRDGRPCVTAKVLHAKFQAASWANACALHRNAGL